MSNIRVSVQWERSTVFAGEVVECTITFKNVAPVHNSRSPSPNTQTRRLDQGRDGWKLDKPKQATLTGQTSRYSNTGARPRGNGHRSTLSLSTAPGSHHGNTSSIPAKVPSKVEATNHRHKRSVSIISIGRDGPAGEALRMGLSRGTSNQTLLRQHGRSASLQGTPLRSHAVPSVISNGPDANVRVSTAPVGQGPFIPAHSSRTYNRSNSRSPGEPSHYFHSRINSLYNPSTMDRPFQPPESRSPSFRFPQSSPGIKMSPDPNTSALGIMFPPNKPEESNGDVYPRPVPRVLSPTSLAGTPRSSTDLYTMSNNSSETLASEYISPTPGRQPGRNGLHSRQPSHLAPIISQSRPPETLMMGYVQLMGSFTLDGSLVNSASFETVKRKGVIGGQGGGGVVGVESPKQERGLFGALGWSAIGESLGGLLGNTEPSSIREMKGIAKTSSVPLISTPQSILFVDLKLGPGQSKSFRYSHSLPRGLPPTHKGRAIKINYNLVIGTQRAQSAAQQHIMRHVDIPFRVLPGVNGNGDILGHDLLQPYILLRNIAHSEVIDSPSRSSNIPSKAKTSVKTDSSPDDLQSYVESLVDKRRQNSSAGLLSPTELTSPDTSRHSYFSEEIPMKDIIDFVVARGNAMSNLKRNANKFQIQRAGEKVATIMLARPTYRLGETVTAVVDFRDATLRCYSVNIALETSETVDSSLALRSTSSIHRATRRVHVTSSEDTLFAQRATFSAMIPPHATPEFITSGVEFQWNLRFEFSTESMTDEYSRGEELVEEIASDDRGTLYAAVQRLPCETFDVLVPIRVYGAVAAHEDRNGLDEYPI